MRTSSTIDRNIRRVFMRSILVISAVSYIIIPFFIFVVGCSSEPKESNLLLPVHFLSMPSGLVKISPFTKNIEISIKGPARLIKKISNEDLAYNVDLYTDLASDPAGNSGTVEPGLYSIPVVESRIPIMPGILITKVSPDFIIIKLDKMISKHFPIKVPYKGKPASGYVALPATSQPEEIVLKGAASMINNIKYVQTKPVDIAGFKEDFKKEVPVDLNNTSEITAEPEIIFVTVPIKEKTITMAFKDLPVRIKNNTVKAVITPSKMNILVKGYANILQEKNIKNKFMIYIDLKGLKQGVYVRRAIINLPVGLILTDAKPEIFTVKIGNK